MQFICWKIGCKSADSWCKSGKLTCITHYFDRTEETLYFPDVTDWLVHQGEDDCNTNDTNALNKLSVWRRKVQEVWKFKMFKSKNVFQRQRCFCPDSMYKLCKRRGWEVEFFIYKFVYKEKLCLASFKGWKHLHAGWGGFIVFVKIIELMGWG